MTAPTDDDRRLLDVFEALGPAPEVTARMESRVLAAYEREQRSLAGEWLDLFRVRPVLSAGFTVAAATGLAVGTPVGTLLLLALLL